MQFDKMMVLAAYTVTTAFVVGVYLLDFAVFTKRKDGLPKFRWAKDD